MDAMAVDCNIHVEAHASPEKYRDCDDANGYHMDRDSSCKEEGTEDTS